MSRHITWALFASSCTLLTLACYAPTTHAGGWGVFTKPTTDVDRLATQIDKLERHLEEYGSVVPKTPDVWGEARLTKYRKVVEEQLKDKEGKFELTINGAISRSDQAFLASTLALQAAVSGRRAGITTPQGFTVQNQVLNQDRTEVLEIPTQGVATTALSPTTNSIAGQNLPFEQSTISLEPNLELNQLHRYLQHLNQLRRINDGDDTSDSPGYAIHLVRIPVSVFPGRKTEEGYGAEITITAKPQLHEKLLQVTFEQLVINDVVDQLAFPLAKFVDSKEGQEALKKIKAEFDRLKGDDDHKNKSQSEINREVMNNAEFSIKETFNKTARAGVDVSIAPFRRAKLPFPTSRIVDIYGESELDHIARLANRLKSSDSTEQQINLLDLNKILAEEVEDSYRFLNEHEQLWQHCSIELGAAIRGHNTTEIERIRSCFDTEAAILQQGSSNGHLRPFAWAIIVEAALLNERLIEDMNEIATAKDCQCLNGGWLPYFLPNPPPEAIHNFNEYVRCRWPIHVFAVDPITEDQNIADSFAQRREMQLALSMAFASGRINAQQFLRYSRQTSLDVDTIALNRTVVGFSHGDDTFGWRFYPRVQTPKTPGNATVVFRDMLYGGLTQDQLLCQRRLEPGQRECTALVIMPSFVPYCTFDMRSNWFKLANPKKKELDLRDGVGISRDIVELRQASAACVKQAHLYRAEDLNHLNRAVDQLESRLPLQTSYVQIPYENTLGGFEFFNTGVTDLAPELKGFYGEPGIDTTKDTTIFVVGDHFSIHETQVIAGNQGSPLTGKDAVPTTDVRFELLSRQIMRVTIPKDTHTYKTKDSNGKPLELVDLHVATPYGVSNHLSIPVIKSAAAAVAEAAQKTAKEEAAAASQKLLQNMGMSYQWMNNYILEAGINSETKDMKLLNSTPNSLGIVREGPQIGLFGEGEAEIAFFITGLTADGKPIPNQIARTTAKTLSNTPDPFNRYENSILGLSKADLDEIVTKALKEAFAEVPPAVQLQGFIRFKSDGAPVIKLNNPMIVKLIKAQSTPTATPNNAFLNPENTPFTSPRPTLADRYRSPQKATITPPLIAQ